MPTPNRPVAVWGHAARGMRSIAPRRVGGVGTATKPGHGRGRGLPPPVPVRGCPRGRKRVPSTRRTPTSPDVPVATPAYPEAPAAWLPVAEFLHALGPESPYAPLGI